MRKTPAKTDRLIRWIGTQPPTTDPSGRAGSMLYDRAVAAGVYDAARTGWGSMLLQLERHGHITREIRGKRTFRIVSTAYVAPTPSEEPAPPVAAPEAPPALSAVPEPQEERLEAPELLTEEESAGWDEARTRAAHAVIDAPPPLRGSVRLELELDPDMARLVLDLVASSSGIVPIDRATTKQLIGQALERESKRHGEGMARALARVAEVERDVEQIAVAIRQLAPGAVVKSNGARAPRPDFRALGVKDSQLRRLLSDLADDGWTLTKASNGHVRASKEGADPIQLPATPSDWRSALNARSQARQHGAAV
jgi:hypothetical protein